MQTYLDRYLDTEKSIKKDIYILREKEIERERVIKRVNERKR